MIFLSLVPSSKQYIARVSLIIFHKSISVLGDINCSFLIQGPQYLGYLTSEQALADFAVLIRHLKVNIKGT